MSYFIKEKHQYDAIKSVYSSIFPRKVPLECNPFAEDFKHFLLFNLDFVFYPRFYIGLQQFVLGLGEKSFFWYSTEPDPESYFAHRYNVFGVSEIAVAMSDAALGNLLTAPPADHSADALVNCEQFAVFSPSQNWAIYLARDVDFGIVGFKTRENTLQFNAISEDPEMFCQIHEFVAHELREESISESWKQVLTCLADGYPKGR